MAKFTTTSDGYTKSFQLPAFTELNYASVGGKSVDVQESGVNAVLASAGNNGDPIVIDYEALGSLTTFTNTDTNLSKTATGTYIGNGTSQTIKLGFKPDFVIVKSATGEQTVFDGKSSFLKRTNYFLNLASIRGDFGIIINEDGFSVGSDRSVNLLGDGNLTYHYFAYCDNGSNSFLQAGYAGNAISGRTVDVFKGTPLRAGFVKRDSGRSVVWLYGDATQNFFYNGSNNVVSTGTTLNAKTGVLTTGTGEEINQWNGLLGEGMFFAGFPENASSTYANEYTGTGAILNLVLPWEPDCIMIIPRNTASAGSRLWMSSFPANQSTSLSSAGIGGALELTLTRGGVTRNLLTLSATSAVNSAGAKYQIMAFKKNTNVPYKPEGQDLTVYPKTVVVNPTGYIDCGTDSSLAISDNITMEFYGCITNIDAVQYVAGGDLDNDVGNQDKIVPLIFRSGGADRALGAVSYGMAVTAGVVTTDEWLEPHLLVCNHDRWQIVNSLTGIELDNYPTNVGVAVEVGKLVHIIVTHQAQGIWNVYVNGHNARETKLDRNVKIGRPNVRGYVGHRTMLLARQRDTISNTNGGAVKLARIYNRALTKEEAYSNYLAISGKAQPVQGFVEEWDANKATNTLLPATNNPANNGVVTNGLVS
jgi:hypothetical protein